MASRINVDEVITLVSDDVGSAIRRLTSKEPSPAAPPKAFWTDAKVITDSRRGYLQQLDENGLADWAARNDATIALLVRPGHYVFPGAPIALAVPPNADAAAAIRDATALGAQQSSSLDLEFAIRHLVEVAVRALSPGINDPHTAIGVLDRLGATLCDIVPRYLHPGVFLRDGRARLVIPAIDYDGLIDAMFHLIRQNARGSPAILIRMLEVLTAVASCERNLQRLTSLHRHAGLILNDSERDVLTPADLSDVRASHRRFLAMSKSGPLGLVLGD